MRLHGWMDRWGRKLANYPELIPAPALQKFSCRKPNENQIERKKGRIALLQMVTQSAERPILPISLSFEDKTVVPEWLRGVSRISFGLNHRLHFACGVLICFW